MPARARPWTPVVLLLSLACVASTARGTDALPKLIERATPGVCTILSYNPDAALPGIGTGFFVASDRDPLTPLRDIDVEATHEYVRDDVRLAFGRTVNVDPSAGIVLTDDYNPVEYYDAANRESYRRSTALAMRQR